MILRTEINAVTGEVTYIAATPAEEADYLARKAILDAQAPKWAIKAQIAVLEASITERMRREALLGKSDINPQTGKAAKQQIQDIDDQITALRAQL